MLNRLKERPKLSSKVKVFDSNGNAFDANGNGKFDTNGNAQFDMNGNGKI